MMHRNVIMYVEYVMVGFCCLLVASDFFEMDVGLALTDWFRFVGTSTKLGFLRRTNTNNAVP